MNRLLYAVCPWLCGLLWLLSPLGAEAQDKASFAAMQDEMNALLDKVYTAPTDNERYNANEQFEELLSEALHEENSFFYDWDFGTKVSVLTASDKQFRIFTWPVVRDDGGTECFGYVQSWNDREDTYDVYVLNDKSDEMMSAEEQVLPPDNWLGCVYQQLIETKYDGKTYYTLLGWTAVDALTQRQVIEPISFRQTGSSPLFGQNVFRREKNRRRLLLQYSARVMVNLRYDEQYVDVVEVKKVKNKKTGRTRNVREVHQEKMKMILFDQVAPAIDGMEGLFQYYVPTGTEEAYVFHEGKWELHDSAQGRSDNERLNKEFAPLPKSDPAYKITLYNNASDTK